MCVHTYTESRGYLRRGEKDRQRKLYGAREINLFFPFSLALIRLEVLMDINESEL